MRSVSQSKGKFPAALLLLFVGSGCAALFYEIVWFQLLELRMGAAALALAILLGTFMGGLCAGSLLLARFVSPSRHPLRVYARRAGVGACDSHGACRERRASGRWANDEGS